MIDIDPRNGGDRWFFEHHADLPQTRTHETRGGGWHLLFRHSPGLRCSGSRIAPGIDVKADGGYVVWWPANCGRVLCEGPVAELPAWVLAASRGDDSRSLILPFASGGDDRAGVVTPSFAGDEKEKRHATPMGGGRAELPKQLYFKVLELVPISATVRRS